MNDFWFYVLIVYVCCAAMTFALAAVISCKNGYPLRDYSRSDWLCYIAVCATLLWFALVVWRWVDDFYKWIHSRGRGE